MATYRINCFITLVVILNDHMRQQGSPSDQISFRKVLLRLRDGLATAEDWKILISRSPSLVPNHSDFDDTIHLFYHKQKVAEHNIAKLLTLGSHIALINGIHSCSTAAAAKSDDAGGTESVLLLAKVMLTYNIWHLTGLCNGATGTITDILYTHGFKPPNLPTAALVNFNHYTGPPFIEEHPKSLPITPHIHSKGQVEHPAH